MQLPTLRPEHRAIARYIVAGLFLLLIALIVVRHLQSARAYARAMNAIADAARKGENIRIQVANFNPTRPDEQPDEQPASK